MKNLYERGSGKRTLLLALADVLPSAQVIDLDTQGTFTKRPPPIAATQATGKHLLYDTPPTMTKHCEATLPPPTWSCFP